MIPVEVLAGDSPVLLSMPHVGVTVPDTIFDRLSDNGRLLADTDWHVDRLYDGLLPGATIVKAVFHRYVIDANRDPSGASLYPGQNTTDLVPLTDFDGNPIWKALPDEMEVAARRTLYHDAYHAALHHELKRLRDRHGIVVLHDCHSIRSRIPRLFEGVLPDFNIGTNDGRSCAEHLQALAEDACKAAAGYRWVSNGRFKGGWITRHYGQPAERVHAFQMELTQSAYLASETPPFAYDADKAERLRAVLGRILREIEDWAFEQVEAGHA